MSYIFEQASRLKLRFKVVNGVVTTEDLWDLSLESLDALAINLHKKIKDEEEGSFIKEKSTINKKTELSFEIVKHIIQVKLAEREEAKDRLVKSERKAAILKILATKQDEALQAKSTEELIKELESLG